MHSGRSRLFSETSESSSNVSSNLQASLAHADRRLSSYASTRIDLLTDREIKRRKTRGLNSRFDRMLNLVNDSVLSKKPMRRRTQTTSSLSSSDMPRTPNDQYDDLGRQRLGRTFSLIKMKPSGLHEQPNSIREPPYDNSDSPLEDSDEILPPPRPQALPEWLASTISTLNYKNPLRSLLPDSEASTFAAPSEREETHPSAPFEGEDIRMAADEQRNGSSFAFGETSHDMPIIGTDDDRYILHDDITRQLIDDQPPNIIRDEIMLYPANNDSNPSQHDSMSFTREYSALPLDPVPFSMPGPASSLSFAIDQPPQILHPDLFEELSEDGYLEHYPMFPEKRHFADVKHRQLPSLQPSLSDLSSAYDSEISPSKHPSPAFNDEDSYMPMSDAVYFDSPIEDPQYSDPMEPAYIVDLNELDFRWTPFIRNNDGSSSKIGEEQSPRDSNETTLSGGQKHSTKELEKDDTATDSIAHPNPDVEILPINQSKALSARDGNTPPLSTPSTPPRHSDSKSMNKPFAPEPGVYISPLQTKNTSSSPSSKPNTPPDRIPFAPEPGVYISPLRLTTASPEPSTPPKQTGRIAHTSTPVPSALIKPRRVDPSMGWQVDDHRAASSQSSNDSIESWE